MAYIDAKYLFKCETCRHHISDGCNTWCENGECYSPNMTKIPTVDVAEVRHGKWIYVDSDLGWREYECSVCHTYCVFDVSEKSHNFCGHCGARMDGDEDDV